MSTIEINPQTRPESTGLAGRTIALLIAATVLVGVAVNLVVWAVGALAGGSFEYTDGGSVQSAAPAGVVVLTAVPLAIGLIAATLLARRWSMTIRVAQVVGSVIALGTIAGTVAADFDTESTVALSITHVTLVPVLVVGLEMVRRRLPARPAGTARP